MNKTIKAYVDELCKVQEDIEDYWSKYEDIISESEEETKMVGDLYNRKAALKAMIDEFNNKGE